MTVTDIYGSLADRYWILHREHMRTKKQNKIMRAALRELTSESCTYAFHEPSDRPERMDPGCPGEVCTAKQALLAARRVPYVNH